MKMMDLCPEERPREKLRLRGARSLSNAELLAILLVSGTEGTPVTEVARELMVAAGGRLALLGAMPLERLITQKGVGEVRAATIAAALELGRRCFEESAIVDKSAITGAQRVFTLMLPSLKGLDHEECWALYLNRAHFLLGREMITSGSLESTLIDTGKVLRRAIEKQASGVILVHNHPSGSPLPGPADIQQTDRLRKALSSVEITLLDHVILAEDAYYSFADDRLIRV